MTFTAPAVGGGNPATFVATLTGTITSNEIFDGNESININFDNTPQVFSYAGGTFTFAVLDMPNLREQSAFENLNAVITATETPEPASLFLMGSGLTVVAWTIRRKNRSGANR